MIERRALSLRQPGQFITVQDGGRFGWKRYGVPRSGAMDLMSLAAANALVGNPRYTPALEFTFVGGTYEMQAEEGYVAVTGGSFPVFHNGERVSAYRSIRLVRGDVLRVGAALDGVWGYVAVAGGVVARLQLGSMSTHVASGIGGLSGRALETGDTVPFGTCQRESMMPGQESVLYAQQRPVERPIRVVLGPQEDYFERNSVDAFLAEDFIVTHQIDRMGYNLFGSTLHHRRGSNIISDGVVAGSIQVPGTGQLIVPMADCQTTGGYPKLATVISADLGRLAQTRPGRKLQFQAVTVGEAHRARLDLLQRFDRLPERVMSRKHEPIQQSLRSLGLEHHSTERDHPSDKDARQNKGLVHGPCAYQHGSCSRSDDADRWREPINDLGLSQKEIQI